VLSAEDRVALGHEGFRIGVADSGTDRDARPRARSAATTDSHTAPTPALTETNNRPARTPPPGSHGTSSQAQQDTPP
jgi:hypothetical protein